MAANMYRVGGKVVRGDNILGASRILFYGGLAMVRRGSFMYLQSVVRLFLPFFYFPKAKQPCASQMMMVTV